MANAAPPQTLAGHQIKDSNQQLAYATNVDGLFKGRDIPNQLIYVRVTGTVVPTIENRCFAVRRRQSTESEHDKPQATARFHDFGEVRQSAGLWLGLAENFHDWILHY